MLWWALTCTHKPLLSPTPQTSEGDVWELPWWQTKSKWPKVKCAGAPSVRVVFYRGCCCRGRGRQKRWGIVTSTLPFGMLFTAYSFCITTTMSERISRWHVFGGVN